MMIAGARYSDNNDAFREYLERNKSRINRLVDLSKKRYLVLFLNVVAERLR